MGPRILSALIVAGLLAGCQDDTVVAPASQVQVLTDAARYSRATGTVRANLVNGSKRPVYMFTCSESTTLEVSEAGGWKDLGAWYATCLGADPSTAIAPAYPYSIEPGTFAALPDLPAEVMSSLDPGTYRMRVKVYANNSSPYELLPDAERVSDPFEIVD